MDVKMLNQESVAGTTPMCSIPKASIRRVMKLNNEVANISAEAIVATTKITEDFISFLATRAYEKASTHNRKTIKVEDIIEANSTMGTKMEFMDGAFGLGKRSYSKRPENPDTSKRLIVEKGRNIL